MPRNKRIEAILAAWWDWEKSEPSARAEMQKELYRLIDAAIDGKPLEREDVLNSLYSHFLEYKRTRKSNEKV